MRTLSTLVLSTTLLFPVLLPSQSPIYSFKGENAADFLGISVSPASDVNLDGYPDLLAGAPTWDDTNLGGTDHGRLYLYSGKDGTLLLTYQGEQAGTQLGFSVSQAQDVNFDGYPDLVTGAPSWDDLNLGTSSDNRGRMYVISGKNGTLLFSANGEVKGDQLGISVSPASDVNQDGYPDLVAGAPFWDDTNLGGLSHGRLYVYSGKDGTLLLTYQGEQASISLGRSVSQAQDVNQDGYADLVTGANLWDDLNLGTSSDNRGRMYVISGKDASLLYTANGEKTGDNLGWSVSPASDVNQDGYPDLVVGAYLWDDTNLGGTSHGRLYVYSGKDATLLFTYQGEQADTGLGWSVSQAQDVNLDGYTDLLAGANSWDDLNLGTNTDHGRMYVISGKDASLLFTANGENAGDRLGYSVSPASDVNLDGNPDLLAGAVGWSGFTGRVYLYSGTSLPLTSDEHLLSISQASTQNLSLSAGASHAGRQYWVFGNFAVNGTSPGVTLGSVNIPLNPDPWTQVTIDFANTAALFMTKGTLDGNGEASASLNSLAPQPAAPLGLTLQHCYLVYQSGPPDTYYMASNLVPWTTVP